MNIYKALRLKDKTATTTTPDVIHLKCNRNHSKTVSSDYLKRIFTEAIGRMGLQAAVARDQPNDPLSSTTNSYENQSESCGSSKKSVDQRCVQERQNTMERWNRVENVLKEKNDHNQQRPIQLAKKQECYEFFALHNHYLYANTEKSTFRLNYKNQRKSDSYLNMNQFQIVRLLGNGSYGRVVLAAYSKTERLYAVKILNKSKVVETQQVQHTINEKRILYACNHANIIRMHTCFKDDLNLYFLLDYYPHGDLYSLLKLKGRFAEQDAKFYATNVYLALEYLHMNNVIYRDLKPENLLVAHNGYIKLTDFGFAKYMHNSSNRTVTICGTPDYFSPEVLQQIPYSTSVDYWAFGIFCYEMCSGKVPFKSGDKNTLFYRIIHDTFEIPSWFTFHLTDLTKCLLQKDFNNRLGCLKNKSFDIRNHKWFYNIDWYKMLKQEIPAPNYQFDNYPKPIQPQMDKNNIIASTNNSIQLCDELNNFENEFEDF